MSNDTIFTIFVISAFAIISLLTVIGAVKEGRESIKKLNEHEDAKRKNKPGQYAGVAEKTQLAPMD